MTRRRNILAADRAGLSMLPENGVVMALMFGDSTSIGWDSTTASIRSTLPGGAELANVTLWNKWDELTTAGGSLRLVHADDGTDWDAMQSDKGVNASGGGAFHDPCYGIGYQLREKYRDVFRGDPDIRIVNMGVSQSALYEGYASTAACYNPDKAGATAWVLMRDYYLAPAITHLLAAGKRIFFESVYSSIGAVEGKDPSVTSYQEVHRHASSMAAFHNQLRVDLGLGELPWVNAKPYDYTDATFTNLADIRAQQELYVSQVPSARLLRTTDTLERNVADGLHFSGEGSLQLGLQLGSVWQPGDCPLQEITAAPA